MPRLPAMWDSFHGFNDYVAKKRKLGRLCSKALNEHAQLLYGMLDKAVLRRPGWKPFKDDVEGLALTLAKYSEVLKKASADPTARQSLDHVVRP